MPGAFRRIVAITIEIERVIARMIEYAVEDQAYSQLLGVSCQRLEIVLRASMGRW